MHQENPRRFLILHHGEGQQAPIEPKPVMGAVKPQAGTVQRVIFLHLRRLGIGEFRLVDADATPDQPAGQPMQIDIQRLHRENGRRPFRVGRPDIQCHPPPVVHQPDPQIIQNCVVKPAQQIQGPAQIGGTQGQKAGQGEAARLHPSSVHAEKFVIQNLGQQAQQCCIGGYRHPRARQEQHIRVDPSLVQHRFDRHTVFAQARQRPGHKMDRHALAHRHTDHPRLF